MGGRWWIITALLCLPSAAAAAQGDNLAAADDPGASAVVEGVYRNDYFGFSYALPPQWRAAHESPAPSESGYYVLGNFVPQDELDATLLIAAQDMFFAARPVADAAEMTRRLDATLRATEGMVIDRQPRERVIAGQRFSEIGFSGVGLDRAMFVTELRCHLVSFTLTASEPARLAELAASLDLLAFAQDKEATPICIKDYASGDNLVQRLEPAAIGPRLVPIPVRFVIGKDGAVRQVHVIRAGPGQRVAIATALAQWRFEPYRVDGQAHAVETGILFRLKTAAGTAP